MTPPGGWGGDDDEPANATAALEVANGFRQMAHLGALIDRACAEADFQVTPSMISELNRLAVDGLVDHPGVTRLGTEPILGSKHRPPPAVDVAGHLLELCEALHSEPPPLQGGLGAVSVSSAIELASYALWRLNWIHPFEDGNGRTARALCYFVLCRAAGGELPGRIALPERIASDKRKYYHCLEQADLAWRKKRRDVSHLAGFLGRHLQAQLRDG